MMLNHTSSNAVSEENERENSLVEFFLKSNKQVGYSAVILSIF